MESDNCQLLEHMPIALCQYLVDNEYYRLFVCFASFTAEDSGDLSLSEGDIIVASSQVNEHWMQGQVCYKSQSGNWAVLLSDQQVGSFPVNHCSPFGVKETKALFLERLKSNQYQVQPAPSLPPPPMVSVNVAAIPIKPPFASFAQHSSSLSSGSSSLHSSDYHHQKVYQQQQSIPPLRPQQLPYIILQEQQQEQLQQTTVNDLQIEKSAILNAKQQDKLKGWLHVVKKKTARLSTRITASLGLISLTRDEEFEKHYEIFKHIEKTVKTFIKNLNTFVEHFEHFLLSLQNATENLSALYRDKSHQKEFDELRKKNKALACEHFHAFKRTVDRQIIATASQLLQKFSAPHQLISKRSVKLLDFDTKTKEMESCRDLTKKAILRDEYVIAKDLYDRINKQLIEELPVFNRSALEIFKECILVLLDSRRNLILSYTKQTASLLDTPLMTTYTASEVAASILNSCDQGDNLEKPPANININELINEEQKDNNSAAGQDNGLNMVNYDDFSRPQSASSHLSSDFNQMALEAREISSTPLSHVGEVQQVDIKEVEDLDEPDAGLGTSDGLEVIKKRHVEGLYSEAINSDDGNEPPVKEASREKRKKKKFPIYFASWPFVATGPNQLSVTCNQPLKLVKGCDECGNSDWSLVQDKTGQLGYVPSTYIKKKE